MGKKAVTESKSVVSRFEQCVQAVMDEKGVFPHVMIHEKNGENAVEFLDLREPTDVISRALNILIDKRPAHLVFGLDRFSQPDQGLSTNDFVSVYFWDDGGWRFGVIEYQDQIARAIMWDNVYWKTVMEKEIKQGLTSLLKGTA